MKYDIEINNEKKIICCILEGTPNVKEAISLALRLREKAAELGFNVFYDARKMIVPESIMPAYDFSTELSSSIRLPAHRAVKVAFFYDSSKFDEHWKFWETASVNRGLLFNGFTDENEAMKWLSSE